MVTIQLIQPLHLQYAAVKGYNISFSGQCVYTPNQATIFRQLIYANGNMIRLSHLFPYFNYTAEIKPLYVQGVGLSVHVNFTTLEYCEYNKNMINPGLMSITNMMNILYWILCVGLGKLLIDF